MYGSEVQANQASKKSAYGRGATGAVTERGTVKLGARFRSSARVSKMGCVLLNYEGLYRNVN